MLCSRCSEPIKPVVAVDIDGTLGDYHGHFWEFAHSWLGAEVDVVEPYRGEQPYREWFCSTYDVDITTFRSIKLAYRQGGLKRTMPVYPGARAFLWAIESAGAELWLTTTRPHDRYDRIDPDTREWIRRHSLPFDGLLFSQGKIAELAERVDPTRVVAVVDDLVENLELATNEFGAGATILRRTRYNQAVRWPFSVLNLREAQEAVIDAINYWTTMRGSDV